MAAITTMAIGAVSAGYQAYQGHEQKRKAQKALQDYDRQDLDKSNAYENIPISTVGSDIMREESQRTTANTVDALRNMGSRGAAMLPGVIADNNRANQESRNYLDDQVNKRNYAIAGDNTAIRGMVEDRENADLAGIGQQMQVGQQNMWSGIRGMGSSLMYAANNVDFNGNSGHGISGQQNTGGGTMSSEQFSNKFNPISKSNLPEINTPPVFSNNPFSKFKTDFGKIDYKPMLQDFNKF